MKNVNKIKIDLYCDVNLIIEGIKKGLNYFSSKDLELNYMSNENPELNSENQVYICNEISINNNLISLYTDQVVTNIQAVSSNRDYVFFKRENCSEYSVSEKARKVLILVFSKSDLNEFYTNLDKFYLNYGSQSSKTVEIIEMSNYFSRHPYAELNEHFKSPFREIYMESKENLTQYGILLSFIIKEFFSTTVRDELRFFNKTNKLFNKKHTLFNQIVEKHIGFKLASVSFIEKLHENDYILDMPFKPYFNSMNSFIKEKNYDTVFYKNAGSRKEYLPGNCCLKFNYFITRDNQIVLKQDFYDYELSFNSELVKARFKELTKSKNNNFFAQWLVFLNYGMFFMKTYIENSYNIDWSRIISNLRFENDNDKPEYYIELLWYIVNVKDSNMNIDGSLNYTLYRVRSTNEFNSSLDEFSTINVAFYHNLFTPIVESYIKEALLPWYQNELINHSARAAISQVMARNMSHNIGSHVLSKFKSGEDTTDIDSKNNQYKGIDALYTDKCDIKDDNKLIAYFNEYLKNRMDFLADIATSDPVMESPMYLVRDIIRGFDKNRILLNRISGVSSDIKFEIKIRRLFDEKWETIDSFANSHDPLLSIPNEVLGVQAFYILLENIIRNIYKHGNPNEKIVITIDVKDYEKDNSFYELSIYDNLGKEEEMVNELVKSRNKALDESILDKDKNYSLRLQNLGTIEMDVCAAYLRRLPIISIEDEIYDLPIEIYDLSLHAESEKVFITEIPRLIYAYRKDLKNNEYTLGYKFHIAKPKEILVVEAKKGDISKKIKDESCKSSENELIQKGILVLAAEEFKESTEIYNHQILYSNLDEYKLNEIIEGKRGELPKRVVFSKKINTDSPEKFIESVWEQYAVKSFLKEKHFLVWSNYNCIIDGTNKEMSILREGPELKKEICKSVFIDNHNESWLKQKEVQGYYDMSCSHSKINKVTDNIFDDEDKKINAEYLEVINTKIVILDERIQQNIVNENRLYSAYGNTTPLKDYFEKQNLFIPEKDKCDLNQPSFGTLTEGDFKNGDQLTVSDNIRSYIQNKLDKDNKVDFFVVHLGILEKMIDKNIDKKESIESLIENLFSKERNKLIITSGRGKPQNIPDDISYVPLALIQNAVETLFDKYLLTKILYNSRKSV